MRTLPNWSIGRTDSDEPWADKNNSCPFSVPPGARDDGVRCSHGCFLFLLASPISTSRSFERPFVVRRKSLPFAQPIRSQKNRHSRDKGVGGRRANHQKAALLLLLFVPTHILKRVFFLFFFNNAHIRETHRPIMGRYGTTIDYANGNDVTGGGGREEEDNIGKGRWMLTNCRSSLGCRIVGIVLSTKLWKGREGQNEKSFCLLYALATEIII